MRDPVREPVGGSSQPRLVIHHSAVTDSSRGSHVTSTDTDTDTEAELAKASKLELERRMAAIRSTAERILDGPVLDETTIEGIARLDVPLTLLTDKMLQSGEKARSNGTPIGSVRYFAKPLQEFADWHIRRLDSDTSDNPGGSVSLLMAVLSESAEYRASIVADDPDREHAIWCAAYRKTRATRHSLGENTP